MRWEMGVEKQGSSLTRVLLRDIKAAPLLAEIPSTSTQRLILAPLKNISEEAGEREEMKEVVVMGLSACRGNRAGRSQEDWKLNFVATEDINGS